MTTIATDGKSIAGDGRMTVGGLISNDACVKVRRLDNGDLIGVSGNAYQLEQFAQWWGGGCQGEPPKFDGSALVVRPGETLHCGDSARPVPIQPPFAIGSGSEIALGAMLNGASPERAVELARCDVQTGGTITVLHLERET